MIGAGVAPRAQTDLVDRQIAAGIFHRRHQLCAAALSLTALADTEILEDIFDAIVPVPHMAQRHRRQALAVSKAKGQRIFAVHALAHILRQPLCIVPVLAPWRSGKSVADDRCNQRHIFHRQAFEFHFFLLSVFLQCTTARSIGKALIDLLIF